MQRSKETFDLCIIVKEVMFGLEILLNVSSSTYGVISLFIMFYNGS